MKIVTRSVGLRVLGCVFLTIIGYAGGAGPALAQEGGAAAAPAVVATAGCKTAYFLMNGIVDSFKEKYHREIQPQPVGNKVALKLLAAGKLAFAFTCQPHEKVVNKLGLKPEQYRNWQSVRIAKDPIAVVVNRKNPVANLTRSQLGDIFSGKITNWKQVGGPDAEIKRAYSDDTMTSGVSVVFRETTLGRDKDGKLCPLSAEAERFPGPKKRGVYVARNIGGITFMGLNAYEKRFGKMIHVDGVEPTLENIISGSYPLAATYYVVFDRDRKDDAAAFLEFMSTEEGTRLVNREFVVALQTDW